MVSIDLIKQLREETGISVGECKKALEQAKGDMVKAKELLRAWGREVASRKQKREAKEGLVEAYVHATGKVGAMIQVRCETDFVSRSADVKNLCHELALQVVSMDPEDVSSLLDQQYVRDTSRTIRNLTEEMIAKLGENIVVERFVRFEL
ncbi:MAG: translation elongation factor Ts [Parcubacteria group bacterium]|nr:translation elongation factor Ts [Parcubacteria group bacterium]